MDEIKSYTQVELAALEWKSRQTIKNSIRYIPVQFYNSQAKSRVNAGIQKNPYTIRYIKLDDIKKLLKDKVEIHYIAK